MSDKPIIIDPNLGMTDHEKITHDQNLYSDAKVFRQSNIGTIAKQGNDMLEDIADLIRNNNTELKSYEYLGSAAVHVFRSRILQDTRFVSQTDLMTRKAHETVADAATIDLRQALMMGYGRQQRKTKRSGFL